MAEIDLPPQVRAIVDELLLRKASSRELGFAAVPRPILDFIDNEFLLAQDAFGDGRIHAPAEANGDAETFFRETVFSFAEGARARRLRAGVCQQRTPGLLNPGSDVKHVDV